MAGLHGHQLTRTSRSPSGRRRGHPLLSEDPGPGPEDLPEHSLAVHPVGDVSEEVWGDEAPCTVELTHEEAVVVHLPVDEDHLSGPAPSGFIILISS